MDLYHQPIWGSTRWIWCRYPTAHPKKKRAASFSLLEMILEISISASHHQMLFRLVLPGTKWYLFSRVGTIARQFVCGKGGVCFPILNRSIGKTGLHPIVAPKRLTETLPTMPYMSFFLLVDLWNALCSKTMMGTIRHTTNFFAWISYTNDSTPASWICLRIQPSHTQSLSEFSQRTY